MVGTVLKYALTYFIGFTSGVIYTTNKYEKNPNEVFGMIGTDVKNAGVSVKDAAVVAGNKVKAKFTKSESEEVVEEAVESAPQEQ